MSHRNWVFLTVIIFLGIIQVTILDYFKIFGVKADLFLISVILSSIFFAGHWALAFSFFSGILKDAFGAQAIGINTLLFPLISILIMRACKEISIDNNYGYFILACAVSIIYSIATRIILLFLGNFIPGLTFSRIIFLQSLYTAAVLLLVLKAVKPLLAKK